MSGSGIYISNSGGWLFQNNTVDNCGGPSTPGVVIEDMPASDAVMTECTITNCHTGLYVNNSDSIELTDNDIYDNTGTGISVHYTNDTLIDYNDVYDNDYEGLAISECYDITLEHNNVTWNGMDGLRLSYSNHTILMNNHFSSNQGDTCEVYAHRSHHSVIVDNDFFDNQFNDGIELYDSDYCNVTGNTISGHTDDGLYLYEADFCVVHDNQIESNGDSGIHIRYGVNNTVTDNTVSHNGDYGVNLFRADNTTIIGNEVGNSEERGVYIYQSDNLYLYDNDVHNSGWPYGGNAHSGVHIYDSLFAEVRENRIYNNSEHGLAVFSSHNATIIDNIIYHNWGNDDVGCGIHVQRSDDINIIGNIIYNNTDHGLFLAQGVDGIISENIIYENTLYGVYLGLQDDSVFDENIVYGNGDSGVRNDLSDNLNMTWNVVFDNTEYGFELVGATNCYLYYNDLGWNDVANAFDDGTNHWNYTGIGNWWSDFNETEGPNYNISSIAIDYYPTLNLIAGTATPLSYELGSTGNLLIWTAGALNPENYTIHVNGSLDLNTVWNGGSVSLDVDGLDVGHYDYMLTVYHISGYSESATSYVDVTDTTSPQWVIDPEDQLVELGSPLSYQVNATDYSAVNWFVNDTTNFAVSNGLITNNSVLAWGDYGLNITVIDVYDNLNFYEITIQVRDTISPFWVVIPQSVSVENGTDIYVTFVATDLSGIDRWEVDDDDFDITDGVLTNAVDLAIGVYVLTITVYDNYGNSNSTAFTVTVVEATATTTPTTPVEPPGVDMLVIVIAGGGAVVVIIVLLGVWSKKRGV
jgi:parallel beta-helix repeat protein